MKCLLITVLTGLLPLVAASHTGGPAHGHDFLSGFVHPLSGLDHLAAMLAVGLWSGLALRRAWQAPLAFVLLMLLGAVAARAGLELPLQEPMIAASVLCLGLLAALRLRLAPLLAAALVGGFAFFHGLAHGAELDGDLALLGLLLATALLHGAGLLLGLALRRQLTLAALGAPVLGGGIALFGCALLLQAVAA